MDNNIVPCNLFHRPLRVLLMDNDTKFLNYIKELFKLCSYEVTTVEETSMAFSMLLKRNTEFDVVLASIDMPDIDGFMLLEYLLLVKDLSVIAMSANDDVSVAIRAINVGASLFLLKPVTLEDVKDLWQFVFEKKICEVKQIEEVRSLPMIEPEKAIDDATDARLGVIKVTENIGKENKEEESKGDINEVNQDHENSQISILNEREELDNITLEEKQPKYWTTRVHYKFLDALNKLGRDEWEAKKICKVMKVPGVTLPQISHQLERHWSRLKRRKKPPKPEQPNLSRPCFGGTSKSKLSQSMKKENLMPFQPGTTSNNQYHDVQPSHKFPIGSMKCLNQGGMRSDNEAALRCKQLLANHLDNMNQALSGATSHMQPNHENYLGFGEVPNHIRMSTSSNAGISTNKAIDTNTTQMLNPQPQKASTHLSAGQGELNLSTSRDQNYNDSMGMSNVELSNPNQILQTDHNKSNNGDQMVTKVGKHGLTLSNADGITEQDVFLGLMQSSVPSSEFTSSNINYATQRLASPKSSQLLNQFPRDSTTMIQKTNDDAWGGGSNSNEGNPGNLPNLIETSRFENSLSDEVFLDEKFFDEALCKEMFFDEPPDGAGILDNNFDISEYQPPDGAGVMDSNFDISEYQVEEEPHFN